MQYRPSMSPQSVSYTRCSYSQCSLPKESSTVKRTREVRCQKRQIDAPARTRPEWLQRSVANSSLDAALQIIVRDGIHKVSMDSVAKEAGVTRPVVYSQFDDTNALLRASLDREESAVIQQLSAIMPTVGVGKPGATALKFLEGFLDAVLGAPDRWRAVFRTRRQQYARRFRKRLESGRRTLIAVIEELVRWAEARGIPDSDTDVELYARALYALIWDAGRTVLAEPEKFPPERILAFAGKLLKRLP